MVRMENTLLTYWRNVALLPRLLRQNFVLSDRLQSRTALLVAILLIACALNLRAQRPPNDDFTNRTVLAGNDIQFGGTMVGSTREGRDFLSELSAGCDTSGTTGGTVWWEWISPADQGPILSILSASALDTFSFTVGGETGRSYRIESSTNVIQWSQETSFHFGSSSSAVREGFTSVVSAQGSTALVELRKSSERKYFRSSRYVSSNEVCNATLKMIRFGKDVWAMEKGKANEDSPADIDLFGSAGVLKASQPRCPQGGFYYLEPLDHLPTCSTPGHVLEEPR